MQGIQGLQGIQGIQGLQGLQGIPGLSIDTAEVVAGYLILTLSDNSTINVGSVIGPIGPQGIQ